MTPTSTALPICSQQITTLHVANYAQLNVHSKSHDLQLAPSAYSYVNKTWQFL